MVITDHIWYRLDYYFDNDSVSSNLKIQDIAADTTIHDVDFGVYSMFNGLTESDKFYVSSGKSTMFDLGLFGDTLDNLGIGITDPLFVHRYSKSVHWTQQKYSSDLHRVRLILKDNIPAIVIYDGKDDEGNFLQNRREEVNHRLVYKKYENISYSDWIWDGTKVILVGYLENVKEVGDDLYVLPMSEDNVRVYYSELDDKIHVRDGLFRGDTYELGVNDDLYYIPEYSKMPFASDDQTAFRPYFIKAVKERANLITPYRIQISTFFVYEGDYPEYVVPNAYEIYRYYDKNGDLQTGKIAERISFQTARGINIYKNGQLLDNSEIVNYNMYRGYIDFRNKFNADDKIEVTYIKKMSDFILTFPSISPILEEGKNFRLYMRPYYPNYSFYNPDDTQEERLCYRLLEDGEPVGNYVSCLTGLNINQNSIDKHEDRIIKLADVAVITDRAFEDIRERGGGIKENPVKDSYKKWPAFLDIGYGVDGKVLYKSIIFIKVPIAVKEDMKSKYFFGDEKDTVIYIKKTIEEYIGSGIFYVLIDENNRLWDEPYPSSITIKK